MLFFEVDRFAEFLIFPNYKVFFFFISTQSPTYTLYLPQTLYLSPSPDHTSLLIRTFKHKNPSRPTYTKYLYIALSPIYTSLNHPIRPLIGLSRSQHEYLRGSQPARNRFSFFFGDIYIKFAERASIYIIKGPKG